MIQLPFVPLLAHRLEEARPLIQVILGPRQVGKTTGVKQCLKKVRGPSIYASADDTISVSHRWIQDQWQRTLERGNGAILVIDEIQKIPNWAEIVKRLWDSQKKGHGVKCVLLGSSSLTLQKGLTESLTGRFELLPVHHWGYAESKKAFGYDLMTYLRYGGYPGADAFIKDYPRWFSFLKSSVVDTVIGQDILTQQTVAKPALFRQAFEILCNYPAQEVSYTTLLGQLHDRGNTDLVKHYLELYEGAYLFCGLQKYAHKAVKMKTSSPKIIPMCPALYTVAAGPSALEDPQRKGHVFEGVVGTDLLKVPGGKVYYWRDGGDEVDYVFINKGETFAIEVKSGRNRRASGLDVFQQRFPKARACAISFDNYARFNADPLAFLETVSL